MPYQLHTAAVDPQLHRTRTHFSGTSYKSEFWLHNMVVKVMHNHYFIQEK
jgi:hypothetical protein